MLRRVVLGLSAVLCLTMLIAPRVGYAESVSYTISNVEVSATAADGTTARMNAMSQAESEAFKRLLEQLLAADEAATRSANAKAFEISRMVRGYEVHDEKVGATSYSATLDVNFDQAQVQNFLNQSVAPATGQQVGQTAGIVPPAPPRVQDTGQPVMRSNVLVLPVLTVNDQTLLWEKQNVWRAIWNRAERSDTQFIRLPIGDQSDSMVMDADQVLSLPYGSFSPIAERYQAATVIVAEAYPTVSSGVNALGVRLRSLGMQGQSNVLELNYERGSNETQDELMLRAAEDVISRIMREGQARSVDQVQAQAPRSKLTVLTRLNELQDYVVIRNRLMGLPIVEQVEVSAISSQQADLVVHFRGTLQQLETAMASQGLQVSKAYNYWVVSF